VGKYDILKLINGNYIDACTMYRKTTWEQCGGYDIDMPAMGHEDWELWLNMSFRGSQFYYLSKPGYFYRVRHNSMNKTVTIPNSEENIKYIFNKYKNQIIKYYQPLYKKYEYYDNLFKVSMKKHKLKTIFKILFNKW
jgi:hypothetical protein